MENKNKEFRKKAWCHSCDENHEIGRGCLRRVGAIGLSRIERLHSLYFIGFLIAIGIVLSWIAGVAEVILLHLSLTQATLGIIILPIFYYFGKRCRINESFNFLYGWHDTSGLKRFSRYMLIVCALTLPFFKSVFTTYLSEFISFETYKYVAPVLIFFISLIFFSALAPLKENYQYVIRSIKNALEALGAHYAGCKYFPLIKKIVLEDLSNSEYLYFELRWDELPEVRLPLGNDPTGEWKVFVLGKINKILNSNFPPHNYGDDAFASAQSKAEIDLLKRRTREGLI
ncbi:MAG: hypothetical protein AB7F59_15050 [Bdellovibrionales bacterium]